MAFSPENFSHEVAGLAYGFLEGLNGKYIRVFNLINEKKNEQIRLLQDEMGREAYIRFYQGNYNDFLASLLKKTNNVDKIVRNGNRLQRIVDPVFLDPENAGA